MMRNMLHVTILKEFLIIHFADIGNTRARMRTCAHTNIYIYTTSQKFLATQTIIFISHPKSVIYNETS